MADSRRYQVLEAIAGRLEAITVAGGFNTDAGKGLYIGFAPTFGTDDPSYAIAVIVGDDDSILEAEGVNYELPIEIHAIASVTTDRDSPWMVIEQMLQDIKRAMELEDRTLGGLTKSNSKMRRGQTRTLRREPGTTTTGVSVTYLVPIGERWGTP